MNVIKADLLEIEEIVLLRLKVLHPSEPIERVMYKKDRHSEAVHLIAKDIQSDIIACGTLIPESELEEYSQTSLRIRGMAVEEPFRNNQIGQSMISNFLDHGRRVKAKKIWCNARVSALSLYERNGFVKTGNVFDVPGSGPHYRMILNFEEL